MISNLIPFILYKQHFTQTIKLILDIQRWVFLSYKDDHYEYFSLPLHDNLAAFLTHKYDEGEKRVIEITYVYGLI